MNRIACAFIALTLTYAATAAAITVPAVFVSRNDGDIEEVTVGSCAPRVRTRWSAARGSAARTA